MDIQFRTLEAAELAAQNRADRTGVVVRVTFWRSQIGKERYIYELVNPGQDIPDGARVVSRIFPRTAEPDAWPGESSEA